MTRRAGNVQSGQTAKTVAGYYDASAPSVLRLKR